MEGVDVLQFARAKAGLNAQVSGGFTTAAAKKLRLNPATDGSTALKTAGAFTQSAIMDFTPTVQKTDSTEENPRILSVHTAQPMPKGFTVSTLFADGSAGIAVKVGASAYMTFVIPVHVREALFKLDRSAGLVPLGAESRITDTQVMDSFF